MAGSGGNPSSGGQSLQAPKILLAKPGLVSAGKFNRGGADDPDSTAYRPRIGSLSLLSDTWDFHSDRFLPFLTDNTDFTVVGAIGPPGVGKSTIMNEIYGFDATSPGMLPPFAIETEETRAMLKHCTVGIQPRVSVERIILLDTRPVFSPSVLAEMIRPDGSSTVPIISGESLPAELAHELMSIQVDLLKHGIPEPSSLTLSHPHSSEKENRAKILDGGEEYMADPVFVHTKRYFKRSSLVGYMNRKSSMKYGHTVITAQCKFFCSCRDDIKKSELPNDAPALLHTEDLTPCNVVQLKKPLAQIFCSLSIVRSNNHTTVKESHVSAVPLKYSDRESEYLKLFLLPSRSKDESLKPQYESHISALWNLRDQVLSMRGPSFSRTVSERDWLKNSAKIWEIVKNSTIFLDYC